MTYARPNRLLTAQIRDIDDSRYALIGQSYRAAPLTTEQLPAGWYDVDSDGVRPKPIECDALHEVACSEALEILAEAKAFWDSADSLIARGFSARRGVLLYGPPGTGKSSLITLLAARAVSEMDAVILSTDDVMRAERALQLIRTREPLRPIILILEDIESFYRYDDSNLLNVLDGHRKVDRVFTIATTNKLQDLDGRLVDRPGRFDRVIEIGPPNANARRGFLKATAPEVGDDEIERWVAKTKGWSIAHLRELVISVLGLKLNADIVFERLNSRPQLGALTRDPTDYAIYQEDPSST